MEYFPFIQSMTSDYNEFLGGDRVGGWGRGKIMFALKCNHILSIQYNSDRSHLSMLF